MEFLTLILCVIPTLVTSITVSSNGNSPDVKMIGGMMVDIQKGFLPLAKPELTTRSNYDRSRKLSIDSTNLGLNSTKLSLNERYRRLIPYMTFYYANNEVPSTTEAHAENIEIEKAEIVEARTIQPSREPKKIVYSQRYIPRYQGNRLSQFNIASANPVKVLYKEVPAYQNPKIAPNYSPLNGHSGHVVINEYDNGRYVQKPPVKTPNIAYTPSTRKPFLNLHNNDDPRNIQYYVSERDQAPKFKLIPYEQTPPVKVVQQNENVYEQNNPIPVPVLVHKDQVYIKPRPIRPQYVYDDIQQITPRRPAVVSENYFEKRPLAPSLAHPVIESGFKPIISPVITTETPHYTTLPETLPRFQSEKTPQVQVVETSSAVPDANLYRPNYYQYVVDPPTYKPEPHVPSRTVTLSDLLNSLQLNKSIPKPITRENVGTSIRTLLQVLNALKAMSQHNEVETPILSTPKPLVPLDAIVEVTDKPELEGTAVPPEDVDLHDEPYLAHVNTPSQHLDDFQPGVGSTSQHFPPPVHSDDEGGTPGQPGVDYPVLTTIPPTAFDCKSQRYKGFFADPETRCQVWHYCDLNGGQASFLCPNGTIFSQAGLTCDWWFNVRCATTTQLYVLNESLYKYILPHSPKFPEDYSGPLVDKYLTLKFKEMEEQFKKNKNKQSASEKIDSDEDIDDKEASSEKNDSEISELTTVSEASVIVESPGTSGNVERLHE